MLQILSVDIPHPIERIRSGNVVVIVSVTATDGAYEYRAFGMATTSKDTEADYQKAIDDATEKAIKNVNSYGTADNTNLVRVIRQLIKGKFNKVVTTHKLDVDTIEMAGSAQQTTINKLCNTIGVNNFSILTEGQQYNKIEAEILIKELEAVAAAITHIEQ